MAQAQVKKFSPKSATPATAPPQKSFVLLSLPLDRQGNVTSAYHAALDYLSSSPRTISYDEFTACVYVDGDILSPRHIGEITGEIASKYAVTNLQFGPVKQAIETIAYKNAFSSINPFLDSIPEWDNVPRLESFFEKYYGAENVGGANNFNKQCGKIFFTQALKRLLDPGCKAELVVVLCGAQGIGKSTLGQKLVPSSALFLDAKNDFGQELVLKMQKSWIVELSELSGMRKKDIEDIKSFISCSVDVVRRPHSPVPESLPRHQVFYGTTNSKEFLKDETGNRRFLPIMCNERKIQTSIFDIEKEEVMQLWAEANVLLSSGFQYWTLPDGLLAVSEFFSLKDELFSEQLENLVAEQVEHCGYVTMQMICNKTGVSDVWRQASVRDYLRSRGLRPVSIRKDKKIVRVWATDNFKEKREEN